MFLYHLPMPPCPPPQSVPFAYLGKRGRRKGGGAHSSDNVEDGAPTLCLNGAEGRRKAHAFLIPKSQGDVLVGLGLSGEFCSLFHLGFPERLRGAGVGGIYLSYSHLV